jgi:hypothetical protein
VFTITAHIKISIDHITRSCEAHRHYFDMQIPPFLWSAPEIITDNIFLQWITALHCSWNKALLQPMYSNGRKKMDHYVASTHFVTASKSGLTTFYVVMVCFLHVEEGKNTSTIIPASCKRRRKGNRISLMWDSASRPKRRLMRTYFWISLFTSYRITVNLLI